MFERVRGLGRKVQAKYESLIEGQELFGFSKIYHDRMQKIKEREKEVA